MENCIYKDRNEPVEARIKDLMSRMTVKEKIGQMAQIERIVATPPIMRDFFIGSVLSCGGSTPFEKALSSDWADMVDEYQKAALETRLGIPIIYGTDAVHGNNNVYGATIFPHNIGLGATRDADLVYKIGVATALEVRASGVQYDFHPCVAVSGSRFLGTTILDAIKEAVGDKTEVVFEQNPSRETFAGQDFSYAIVAVGEPPYVEFGGDDPNLIIPFGGSEIISSVADRIPTLAILISGRPLVIEPSLLEKVDALVAAWLPGSEGGGITDVVFGDYEFQGRLPMTWFRSVEQLPLRYGEKSYDPLFPLGFGLTSTNMKLSN